MSIIAPVAPFPESLLSRTARQLAWFRDNWTGDAPTRMHQRELDDGGVPAFTRDFESYLDAHWIDERRRDPEYRLRVTKAMRKLRRESVREYEVTYRVMVLGDSISSTAKWLTERAIRNGKPERYGPEEVVVILIAAVSYLDHTF